jgi:hypothetical protein
MAGVVAKSITIAAERIVPALDPHHVNGKGGSNRPIWYSD